MALSVWLITFFSLITSHGTQLQGLYLKENQGLKNNRKKHKSLKLMGPIFYHEIIF